MALNARGTAPSSLRHERAYVPECGHHESPFLKRRPVPGLPAAQRQSVAPQYRVCTAVDQILHRSTPANRISREGEDEAGGKAGHRARGATPVDVD